MARSWFSRKTPAWPGLRVILLVAALGAFALAAPVEQTGGRDLHVQFDGDDDQEGSQERPWRTLQHAAGQVGPGDRVHVAPGHYQGFQLRTSGTPQAPITFQAAPGAVVTRPNPHTGDGINLEGASHIAIDGFTVIGMPRAGIRSVTNDRVVLRNNHLDRNGSWGILTGFSENVLIEANTASRSGREHGIYVSNSADNPVIRGNIVWGNNASGIQINADRHARSAGHDSDGVITGAIVEQNVVFDNGRGGGAALNFDGVRDSVFRNNTLLFNHASGITLYRIDGAEPSGGNLIEHNTIIQSSRGRWAVWIANAGTGNTLRNNVLINHHPWRGSIAISEDALEGFTSNQNHLTPRLSADGGATRLSLEAWRQATGQDIDSTPAPAGAGSAQAGE